MTCRCGHIRSLHPGDVACRINGCRCEEFRDPATPATEQREPRTVTFEVPDGYMFTISFVPYDPAAPAGAEEEGS